jgi:hypothetical protein
VSDIMGRRNAGWLPIWLPILATLGACGRTELDDARRAPVDAARAAAPDASVDRGVKADATLEVTPDVAADAGVEARADAAVDAGVDQRPQICRERPFLAARQQPAPASPTGMALQDLNGDGLADLVVTTYMGVSVFLAGGDALLGAPTLFPAGSFDSRQVLPADLDGDGRIDLIVRSNYSPSGGIFVLMGRGDGSFGPAVGYGTGGATALGLALADLDGDGRLDILAAREDRAAFSVLLGRGDGTFAAETAAPIAGDLPGDFAVADFDEDGRLDVAFDTAAGLRLSRGNGDGTFRAPEPSLLATDGTNAIVARDLDGDGHADLLVASYFDSVAVLLGKGDGTFAPAATVPVPIDPDGLAIGDLDGDGQLDFVTANIGSDDVSLVLGGGVAFRPGLRYVAGSSPLAVGLGDVNGDGTLDVAVIDEDIGNSSGGEVSVLPGYGDGTFAAARSLPLAGSTPLAVALGDLDGDGRLDLVGANSGGSVTVARGDGRGSFGAPTSVSLGAVPIANAVALADMDGDGHEDLVTAAVTSGLDVHVVQVMRGAGDGTFGAPTAVNVGRNPSGLAIADFDGDGKLDVASADTGDDQVTILLGRPLLGPARSFAAGSGPSSVVAGDFDGDGKIDLVVADSTASDGGWLRGNGNGTFAAARTFATALHPQTVAAGDFDGDGRLDVVTAGRDSKQASVLLGNGDGTFQAARNYPLVSPGNDYRASVVVADIDHDGKLDLAVALGGNVSVLFGVGDGTFDAAVPSFSGLAFSAAPSYSLALGDLDGDGLVDVVTADTRGVGILLGLAARRCR